MNIQGSKKTIKLNSYEKSALYHQVSYEFRHLHLSAEELREITDFFAGDLCTESYTVEQALNIVGTI